jgi:hypothetical protein
MLSALCPVRYFKVNISLGIFSVSTEVKICEAMFLGKVGVAWDAGALQSVQLDVIGLILSHISARP